MAVVLSLGTSYTLCHLKAWPLPTWADRVASLVFRSSLNTHAQT